MGFRHKLTPARISKFFLLLACKYIVLRGYKSIMMRDIEFFAMRDFTFFVPSAQEAIQPMLRVKVHRMTAGSVEGGSDALDFFTSAAYVSQLRDEEDEVAGSSSMLHVRIDDEVKKQATEALAAMGLSASDAVRLLFHRVVADQAFPLELKVPSAATREAMAEADSIVADRRARFADGEALIGDLDG